MAGRLEGVIKLMMRVRQKARRGGLSWFPFQRTSEKKLQVTRSMDARIRNPVNTSNIRLLSERRLCLFMSLSVFRISARRNSCYGPFKTARAGRGLGSGFDQVFRLRAKISFGAEGFISGLQ